MPRKYFFTVLRIDRTKELVDLKMLEVSRYHELFQTEIREIPSIPRRNPKLDAEAAKKWDSEVANWREELQFHYFPEHETVSLDVEGSATIRLKDGIEIYFRLRHKEESSLSFPSYPVTPQRRGRGRGW